MRFYPDPFTENTSVSDPSVVQDTHIPGTDSAQARLIQSDLAQSEKPHTVRNYISFCFVLTYVTHMLTVF